MNDQKSALEELIESSNNIAVIPSQVAGYDAFAAALGLFLGIREKGKRVSLVYPDAIPEGFEDLITTEEIMTDPSLRELIVTVDYHNSPAKKVDYSAANDMLTLKISPINYDFNLSSVKASISGLGFDLIFVIGAQVKEDLGISYKYLEEEFRAATVVNLDHTGLNTKYGSINIVDPQMDNLSLLIMHTMIKSGMFISQRSAKALLRGISYRVVN